MRSLNVSVVLSLRGLPIGRPLVWKSGFAANCLKDDQLRPCSIICRFRALVAATLIDSSGRRKIQTKHFGKLVFAVFAIGLGHSVMAQTTEEYSVSLSEGLEIYSENCAICHGPSGEGDGSLANQFTPRPRDFARGSFRFKSTGFGEPPTATDILRVITRGVEGSYGRSMPSFEYLTFDEQVALLAVIQNFAGFEKFGTAIEVPLAPETANAARGNALYLDYGCIACHGVSGDGRGTLADGLRDDNNHPILPSNFQVGMFKGGNDPDDIWMRLQTGIEGTPMSPFGRDLTLEESWSLVEYVLEFSKKQ